MSSILLCPDIRVAGVALATTGKQLLTSSTAVVTARFNCKDCMWSVNHGWNMQSSENYRNVILKTLDPFIYVIERTAVRVFAFKPYIQRGACQKKGDDEFKSSVPGKREDPSEK